MARAAASTSRNVVRLFETLTGLTSTATRVAPGTSSRRSSSRFALSSILKKLMPVRLPPGPARLATRPSPTGSSAHEEDDGDRRGCRLGSGGRGGTAGRGDHGNLTANQFGRQRRQSIELTVGPAILDRYVLDLRRSRSPSGPGGMRADESANGRAMRCWRNPITGIAACCARAASGQAAAAPPSSADELPPPHAGHGLPPRCRRRSYQLEPPGAGGLTHQEPAGRSRRSLGRTLF